MSFCTSGRVLILDPRYLTFRTYPFANGRSKMEVRLNSPVAEFLIGVVGILRCDNFRLARVVVQGSVRLK
jgi:hypothetical protein